MLPGFLLIFQLLTIGRVRVHVRLGQAGAGLRLEVPRPTPRHGGGRRGRPGDELLPRLGAALLLPRRSAAGNGSTTWTRPSPASDRRPVPVLLHADQPRARAVQPAANSAAGRRPHRGRAAAAEPGARLGAAGALRHRDRDPGGVPAAAPAGIRHRVRSVRRGAEHDRALGDQPGAAARRPRYRRRRCPRSDEPRPAWSCGWRASRGRSTCCWTSRARRRSIWRRSPSWRWSSNTWR